MQSDLVNNVSISSFKPAEEEDMYEPNELYTETTSPPKPVRNNPWNTEAPAKNLDTQPGRPPAKTPLRPVLSPTRSASNPGPKPVWQAAPDAEVRRDGLKHSASAISDAPPVRLKLTMNFGAGQTKAASAGKRVNAPVIEKLLRLVCNNAV